MKPESRDLRHRNKLISFDTAGVARVITGVLATIIVVLSVVPASGRPETGAPHALEHFAIFLATGFAAGVGWPRKHALLSFLLVIFAGLVEIAQLFVPGRHARVSDFTVDVLAGIIGLMVSVFWGLMRAERRGL